MWEWNIACKDDLVEKNRKYNRTKAKMGEKIHP